MTFAYIFVLRYALGAGRVELLHLVRPHIDIHVSPTSLNVL